MDRAWHADRPGSRLHWTSNARPMQLNGKLQDILWKNVLTFRVGLQSNQRVCLQNVSGLPSLNHLFYVQPYSKSRSFLWAHSKDFRVSGLGLACTRRPPFPPIYETSNMLHQRLKFRTFIFACMMTAIIADGVVTAVLFSIFFPQIVPPMLNIP